MMTRPGWTVTTTLALGALAALFLTVGGGRAAGFAGAEVLPPATLYVKTVTGVDRNTPIRCNPYDVTVIELGETRQVRQYHPVVGAVVKCDPEFVETPHSEIVWRDYDEETVPQLELSYVKAWCEGGNGERIDPLEVRLLCYENTID